MKRVFLTGASSGIGYTLAKKIAERGAELLLLGRDNNRLEQLQKELKNVTKVEIFPGNLQSKAYLAKIQEKIASDSFDMIINNAGLGWYGSFHELSLQEQMEEMDVNIHALVWITHIGVQTMLQKKIRGTIVNVSSLASFFPTPGMAIYGATKAFVTSFSQAIHYELKETPISVLVSCPGMVDTKFSKRASKGQSSFANRWSMQEEFAADAIMRQIDKQQILAIFDGKAKFVQKIIPFIPKSWIYGIVQKNLKERCEV